MWNSRWLLGIPIGLAARMHSSSSISPPGGAEATVQLDELVPLIEQALRTLNRPGALSSCALIAHLPYSMAAAHAARTDSQLGELTPLEQARALRRLVNDAIQQLNSGAADSVVGCGPDTLQFQILAKEYLQELPTRAIALRHSISESTLYRYRREAIQILARELQWQEESLARRLAAPARNAGQRARLEESRSMRPVPAL